MSDLFLVENNEEVKEPVEIEGVPYIDEYGNEHEDLLLFKSDNGKKIFCDGDGEMYNEAVVFKNCASRFFETEEDIDVPSDPVDPEEMPDGDD